MPLEQQLPQGSNKTIVIFVMTLIAVTAVCAVTVGYVISVPSRGEISFRVASGATGSDVARILKENDIVRSSVVARIALTITGKSTAIKAGVYTIDTNLYKTIFSVAYSIVDGDSLHQSVLVTIQEGSRGGDIIAVLKNVLAQEMFQGVTPDTFDVYLGYLFPDTYAIDDTTTPEDFIKKMQNRYEEQIAPLREQIQKKRMTEREVVITASLLEKEANSEETMRMISGILRNRLERGMRLQLDAPLTFLFNKTSDELTQDDLSFDSPYNTYRYTGLPPTPIANPGLVAIKAVLDPIESDYLFYLTGSDGKFYYAKTFEEHVENKRKHLR